MNRIKRLWKNYYYKPTNRIIRWFGILLALALGIAVYLRLGFTVPLWFSVTVIPLLSLVFLPILRLVYATMMLITKPIGWLVSFSTLLVIYMIVLTPFSFLRKRTFPSGWHSSESLTDAAKMHE